MTQFDETVVEDTSDEVVDDDTQTDDNGEIAGRIDKIEQNQALNALIADPDIQKIITLKKAGKTVSVAEYEEVVEEEELDPNDTTPEVTKRLSEMIDKRMSSFMGRLEAIEDVASKVQKKGVDTEINDVRKDFPDFDKYKDTMIALSQESPGLSVKELYTVARSRAGKLDLSPPDTFSEKPTTPPRHRIGSKIASPGAGKRGRQAFNNLVTEALKGIDITME